MLFLLGTTAALLTVLIVALVAYRFFYLGEPPTTWRNFFLLGFLQFYTISVAHWSVTQWQSPVYVPRGEVYHTLAASMVVFLGLFFLAYGVAFKWEWPDRWFPQVKLPMTTSTALVLTAALTAAGLATVGFTGGSIGDSIVFYMRVPLASAATGCAMLLVLSNPRNPVWWLIFLPVMGIGLIMSTVGTIDRRNFLSVLFIVAWLWYYLSLRFQSRTSLFIKLGIAASIGFVLLASYNTVRQRGGFGAGFEDRLKQATQLASTDSGAFSSRNLIEGILLQDTHVCTQAIMENYPDPWPYIPLHGYIYYFVNPIPRVLFPGKPEGLGIILQKQLAVPANLGVGCIGHGWAEMAWVGVIYYALTLGAICAVFDRLARKRANDPFFMVTIGCALGNVLGLARGETSLFLVIITVGIVSCLTLFWLMKLVLGPYMLVGRPMVINGRTFGEPIDEASGLPLAELGGDDALQGGAAPGGDHLPDYDEPFGHDDPAYGRGGHPA